MKVRTNVRAGVVIFNRCENLKVRAGVKAGAALTVNRCENLKVRTGVKAGALTVNRCESLKVRNGVKAGRLRVANRYETFRAR